MIHKQNTPFRVAILISGRGSNMEAVLRSVRENSLPVSVVCVLSDRRDAKGLDIAASYGVQTEVVERGTDSKDEFFLRLTQRTAAYAPDLVVLAGFMRIISPSFLSAFENKVINIHPSLLPKFKGLNAQQQALEAGETESGCTVHFVTPEVDAGAIIAQATVPILPGDTAEALADRILEQEHELLPAVVYALSRNKCKLLEGKVLVDQEVQPQSNSRRTIMTIHEQLAQDPADT